MACRSRKCSSCAPGVRSTNAGSIGTSRSAIAGLLGRVGVRQDRELGVTFLPAGGVDPVDDAAPTDRLAVRVAGWPGADQLRVEHEQAVAQPAAADGDQAAGAVAERDHQNGASSSVSAGAVAAGREAGSGRAMNARYSASLAASSS